MNVQQAAELIAQMKEEGIDVTALSLASAGKTSLGLNRWVATDKPTMADFNEDNRIIDEKLRELGEKKIDKETESSFAPKFVGVLSAGTFNYVTQQGLFKKIDDYVIYSFVVTVSNFLSSGASGALYLQMPIPLAGESPPGVAVAYRGTLSPTINGLSVYANGRIIRTGVGDAYLLASEITSNHFGVTGQIAYKFK